MLANMASSLIMHKRIATTVAKAKALRVYLEPLITKSKTDTTANRRVVFSNLRDKYAVKELFGDVAAKIANRPGGYTRILKTGYRLGDAAQMCVIELVDYNPDYSANKSASSAAAPKKKTRRAGGKKKAETAAEVEAPKAEAPVEEAKAEEAQVEEPKAE
jgi:large subunit ribosomal protein L17